MIKLVSDSAISHMLLTFILLVFQVFEDGSTYRGRLKLLSRTVVKACYEDVLQPNIMDGHNSDQAATIVRDNVTKILDDSTFLLAAEPDENVSFENHYSAKWWIFLSTRAAPRTLLTKPLSSLLSNFITLARLTASRFYFQQYLANIYRSVVLQWFAPVYVHCCISFTSIDFS